MEYGLGREMQNVCRNGKDRERAANTGGSRDFYERRWLATHHDDYCDFNACCFSCGAMAIWGSPPQRDELTA